MVNYIKSKSILESDCDILINPVNCVGVMGKGLALEFKNKFPSMFTFYEQKCSEGKIIYGGRPLFFKDSNKIIILFPTKNHWKEKSDLTQIERSLFLMVQSMNKYSEFHELTLACPKLGCGLGGLSWNDVRPKLEYYLSKINCKGINIHE